MCFSLCFLIYLAAHTEEEEMPDIYTDSVVQKQEPTRAGHILQWHWCNLRLWVPRSSAR